MWKKTFKTIHQLSCFVGQPVPAAQDSKGEKATFITANSFWKIIEVTVEFNTKHIYNLLTRSLVFKYIYTTVIQINQKNVLKYS